MKTYFLNPFLILCVLINISCSQKKNESAQLKYLGNITAPDFPTDLEWLNTDKPLSLKDLKGKLVLLDFWTYACINCMHIIPDLKMLEQKYREELAVIGVHSAKFLTERGTENIRQAILRYDIEHPVINDKDLIVWTDYDAHAWPTLVLIDPKGNIITVKSGEGVFDFFDPLISAAVKEYDDAGSILDRSPVNYSLEKEKTSESLLSFPGKVTVDQSTSRLFVSDSNNNRILVLKVSDSGEEAVVEEVIGSGSPGQKNGTFAEAEFFKPQGLTLYKDKLYVADTENHLIRQIDLNTGTVTTIAGTGQQSQEYGLVLGPAKDIALSSPWDVVVVNDALYIAMAGAHQLWKLDLVTKQIGTYAGSGRENIVDGIFGDAALAQPSGITTDGLRLFFADSEVSGVRSADLDPGGNVRTIVGHGLFDFGDIDGIGIKARLQHPLGIFYNASDRLLYIADTYNNKIKTVNPMTKESKTFSGTGSEGYTDGIENARFNEPGGLVVMNGKLFITDTNNHILRVLDMRTREVKTVRITNPSKLMSNIKSDGKRRSQNAVVLAGVDLRSGENKLRFSFTLPGGFKINPDAKPQVAVSSDGITDNFEVEVETESAEFEVPIKLTEGKGKINIEVLIYYCESENIGLCKFKDLFFEIPSTVSSSGSDSISIDYTLN